MWQQLLGIGVVWRGVGWDGVGIERVYRLRDPLRHWLAGTVRSSAQLSQTAPTRTLHTFTHIHPFIHWHTHCHSHLHTLPLSLSARRHSLSLSLSLSSLHSSLLPPPSLPLRVVVHCSFSVSSGSSFLRSPPPLFSFLVRFPFLFSFLLFLLQVGFLAFPEVNGSCCASLFIVA